MPSVMNEIPDIDALLADASKLLPIRQAIRIAGVPLSYPAAIRMALAGRLPSVRLGGRRLTTPEAVLATVRAMSALPDRAPTAPRQRRKAPRTLPQSRRALAAFGIKTIGGGRDE